MKEYRNLYSDFDSHAVFLGIKPMETLADAQVIYCPDGVLIATVEVDYDARTVQMIAVPDHPSHRDRCDGAS